MYCGVLAKRRNPITAKQSRCGSRSPSGLVEATRYNCVCMQRLFVLKHGQVPTRQSCNQGPEERCPGTGSSGCLTGYLTTRTPHNICRDAPDKTPGDPLWQDVRNRPWSCIRKRSHRPWMTAPFSCVRSSHSPRVLCPCSPTALWCLFPPLLCGRAGVCSLSPGNYIATAGDRDYMSQDAFLLQFCPVIGFLPLQIRKQGESSAGGCLCECCSHSVE